MRSQLGKILGNMGVEFFEILDYSHCKETSSAIISRAGFIPKSLIIYLLPYYTGECVNISRYAASYDYHLAIRATNDKIEELLKKNYPNSKIKGYGDHSPIDERHAALVGGLGILGDNGLLINEKYGSYIFIGDVITDIPPDILGAKAPNKIEKCRGCGRCLAACPTGILRGEGGQCLSYVTQKKGELSKDEQELMRRYNTAWGCDVCQSSCPHNQAPKKTPIEFFYRDRIEELSRDRLDKMDKEAFGKRAFSWRGRKTVERNLDVLK